MNNMAQEGWICPRCGKVNAPWVTQCSCSKEEMKVTCTDNTTCTCNTTPKYETTCTCDCGQEKMICS